LRKTNNKIKITETNYKSGRALARRACALRFFCKPLFLQATHFAHPFRLNSRPIVPILAILLIIPENNLTKIALDPISQIRNTSPSPEDEGRSLSISDDKETHP